jgi:hypothetical protein
VVARSAGDVWAVGIALQGGAFPHALAEQWSGGTWHIDALPATGADDALMAVAAIPGGGLWAVGFTDPTVGAQEQTLILRARNE